MLFVIIRAVYREWKSITTYHDISNNNSYTVCIYDANTNYSFHYNYHLNFSILSSKCLK